MRFSIAIFCNPVRIYLCEREKERCLAAKKIYLKLSVDLIVN